MEKLVTFPGLNLEFTLDPILLPISGSFSIHWYGAIIAVGFLLAVLFGLRQAPRFGITQDDGLDMLFFAVPLAIIGARLYYVAFEFKKLYYVPGDVGETLRKIVRIWDGGLAIYGGIIAAALTLLVFCKVKKINFLAFADVGSMGLLIGQLVGRWGNFVNVEAFGSVTDVPWRMAGPTVAGFLQRSGQIDETTYEAIVEGTLGVHPTFFYESMWNLIGFLIIVLVIKNRRKFDGQIFLTYFAWYGVGRFLIEGLRTDSLFIAGTGMRVSQLMALVFALTSIAALVYMLVLKKTPYKPLYVQTVAQGTDETEENADDEFNQA